MTKVDRQFGQLYTPITPQVRELMEELKERHGSWRMVGRVCGVKLKVMRRIRHGGRVTVSYELMDRFISRGGCGDLDDFEFFRPRDVMALGIWSHIKSQAERSAKRKAERMAKVKGKSGVEGRVDR